MNCICRGVSVPVGPVFTVVRIWPKVEAELSFCGRPYWPRSKKLKASATCLQNCSRSRNWN